MSTFPEYEINDNQAKISKKIAGRLTDYITKSDSIEDMLETAINDAYAAGYYDCYVKMIKGKR